MLNMSIFGCLSQAKTKRALLFNHKRLFVSPRLPPVADLAVGGTTKTSHQHRSNHLATAEVPIPEHLERVYWWAYLHPKGVHFFERPWIVNLILWGNYDLLASQAISEIDPQQSTLQIACAYGNVTPRLAEHMQVPLDVVDVAPIQLDNLKRKLNKTSQEKVNLIVSDASNLSSFQDECREQVLFFFLLHELPEDIRRQSLLEAWRVLNEGGKLIIIDYHRPTRWSFQRYFMPIIFHTLEPFAMDLWEHEIITWLPKATGNVAKNIFFQGLYQKLVIIKE